MPHIDITMIPGRDEATKKTIALHTQQFIAAEFGIDEKFVSVSIEDIPKDKWGEHMESMKDKIMFVKP